MFIFLFKQKTAYEMRISDWRSDVCSSDLASFPAEMRRRSKRWQRESTVTGTLFTSVVAKRHLTWAGVSSSVFRSALNAFLVRMWTSDRKSVVSGKSVSVRVVLGGRRIINNKKTTC